MFCDKSLRYHTERQPQKSVSRKIKARGWAQTTSCMRGNEEENRVFIKISDDIHKDEYYYFLEANWNEIYKVEFKNKYYRVTS